MNFLKSFFIFFLILGNLTHIFSSQSLVQYQKACYYLERMGEVYFKFDISSPSEITKYANELSIDKLSLSEVFAFANEDEFNNFLKLNIPYEVLTAPSLAGPKPIMSDYSDYLDNSSPTEWDEYPTYSAYKNLMSEFETKYPNKVKVYNLGKTDGVGGRKHDILIAKVSENVEVKGPKAEFLFCGCIHGNEYAAYVMMLRMIDWLCSNYNKDPRATRILDSMDVWINPLANPDGSFRETDYSLQGATRLNRNNKDLNRNYPIHPKMNRRDPIPETETKYFIKLEREHNFVMNVDFHGGIECALYPWSAFESPVTTDDEWWKYVCRVYADLAQENARANGNSGYMNDLRDGVSQGCYLGYPVVGSTKDYFYYFVHTRGISLELTSDKTYPAGSLNDLWDFNFEAFLAYMQEALNGIRGIVTDRETKRPLEAKVFVKNHDRDSTWVYADSLHGNYYRPIHEGTYDVTFSCDSCEDKTVRNIKVKNGEATIVNVELECEFAVGINNTFQNNNMSISVLPNRNGVRINLKNTKGIVKAGVYNIAGKLVKILENSSTSKNGYMHWNGLDNNGSKVGSGCYIVKIKTVKGELTKPFMLKN